MVVTWDVMLGVVVMVLVSRVIQGFECTIIIVVIVVFTKVMMGSDFRQSFELEGRAGFL